MVNLFFKKESLCLMYRLSLLFSFHPPSLPNTQLKEKIDNFVLGALIYVLLK